MGFAICRFNEETVCSEKGSSHYYVTLNDLKVTLNVPSMWKHYLTKHLVQPTKEEREIVMKADPKMANGKQAFTFSTRNISEIKDYTKEETEAIRKKLAQGIRELEKIKYVNILYVENLEKGKYTHDIGTKVDTEFIGKLEQLLEKGEQEQTKRIKLPEFDF